MSTVSCLSVGHICEIINKTEGGHYTSPYVGIIDIDVDDMNGQNIKVEHVCVIRKGNGQFVVDKVEGYNKGWFDEFYAVLYACNDDDFIDFQIDNSNNDNKKKKNDVNSEKKTQPFLATKIVPFKHEENIFYDLVFSRKSSLDMVLKVVKVMSTLLNFCKTVRAYYSAILKISCNVVKDQGNY